MSELPSGTVVFLMTDVVGSTPLWEAHPADMPLVMARHDELGQEAFGSCGGQIVRERGEGDSLFVVFSRATDALRGAGLFSQLLAKEVWPSGIEVHLRTAIHIGEPNERGREFYGSAVNRCARLRSIANPDQTLVSGAVSAIVAGQVPEGLDLMPMGLHRLKDLLLPEEVFLLTSSGARPIDTPLRSLEAVRHNLPVRRTSFVGRRQELAKADELLRRSRLVTLTGAGGTGKTSIAIQVGAERAEEYAGGVWFVDLSSPEIAGDVTQAVARPMGAKAIQDPIMLFGLEPTLVLLDNCETWVEEVAQFAQAVLDRCPNVVFLATSREPLRISGEHILTISPLSVSLKPDSLLLEDLESMDSFQLFLDRVVQRKSDFKLDQTVGSDIAAICRAVDGIPLAIEQVATHITTLTTRQIRERLADRLALAKTRDRGIPERHATLRATIAWSVDTLDRGAKDLFTRLAIFPDGWTLDAAEHICADAQLPLSQVFDLLTTLVEKSLVNVSEQSDGQSRYRFLETIRQFATELQGGGDLALQRRYVGWFLALAVEAHPHLARADRAEWLAQLDQEAENLRRALRWCEELVPEKLVGFANSLRRYWFRRGQMAEGLRWLSRGIELAPDRSSEIFGQALDAKGTFEWHRGEFEPGRQSYEEAVSVFLRLGLRGLMAGTLVNLANLDSDEGQTERALDSYQRASTLYHELGDEVGVALCQENTAILELNRGNYLVGIDLLNQCLPIFRSRGELNRVIHSLVNLCDAFAEMGSRAEALATAHEVLELWPEAPDVVALATVGVALIRFGCETHPEKCAQLCGGIEKLLSQTGDLPVKSKSLRGVIDRVSKVMGEDKARRFRTLGNSLGTLGTYAQCQELVSHLVQNRISE